MTDEEKKILSNVHFAIRSEYECLDASEEYIAGYVKGVMSALYDLDYSPEFVTSVRENLLLYRSSATKERRLS